MYKSALIYSQSNVYGGTEVLFSNVLIGLNNLDYIMDVVEPKECMVINGILQGKSVLLNNFNFFDLDERNHKKYNVVIVSSKDVIGLSKYLEINNLTVDKVIVWQLHPNELISQFLPFANYLSSRFHYSLINMYRKMYGKKLRFLCDVVSELTLGNSFWFMDGANKESTEKWLGCDFNSNYLPIAAELSKKTTNTTKKKDKLVIYCLGRISNDFKFFPNINMVEGVVSYANLYKKKILIKFIGDGNAVFQLKAFCESMRSPYVEFSFLGFQKLDMALDLIAIEADIVFAMGTSALNSASCRVPVVLMDSYSSRYKFSVIKYIWLYETVSFSVGRSIANIDDFKGKNVEGLLSDFESNSDHIAGACCNYVKNNHSIDQVLERLINVIDEATVSGDDFKYMINKVFRAQRFLDFFIKKILVCFKK